MSETPQGDRAKIDEIINRKRPGASGSQAQPEEVRTPQEPPSPTKEPARIHPNKRGQLMLSNLIAELSGDAAQNGPEISYYSPELIQATLPHSDPKTRDWKRTNGNFTLIVSSGVDDNLQPFGIPYGSFPRLVLAHIITQVVATHERRIELSSHFGKFLSEVGYVGNHKGESESGKRIREQLIRLLRANITFQYKDGDNFTGRFAATDIKVAPKFDLWWLVS